MRVGPQADPAWGTLQRAHKMVDQSVLEGSAAQQDQAIENGSTSTATIPEASSVH